MKPDTRKNPLQFLYSLLHERTFRNRLKKQARFGDLYVISVGNLSAGGTGKTPVVRYLGTATGPFGPLAVLRGYRGNAPSGGLLVSDGERILTTVQQAGDEAILLARTPGLHVAVGRDRVRVIENFSEGCRVVLLDDAFQNPMVYRDHDLVLLDATVPLEDLRLLPTGRFREDLNALERADSVLLTRTDLVDRTVVDRLRIELQNRFPELPVFESIHRPEREFASGSGIPGNAFCGIGNPEGFFRMLARYGFNIKRKKKFPDHHPYSSREILHLMEESEGTWFTTEKDLVRILELEDLPEEVLERIEPVPILLQIMEDREEEFLSTVLGAIHS